MPSLPLTLPINRAITRPQPVRRMQVPGASFYFLYFSKTFFIKIYFQFHNLQFCTPTARQGGGRGPAARQEGGRDLYVNKKNLFARRPLAGACRPAGGRQAPPQNCSDPLDVF